MKEHPKITLVTACYNSEAYLEDCIKSILNQTYDNIEHIIVDGKSTDHTLDIIKRYDFPSKKSRFHEVIGRRNSILLLQNPEI